MTEKSIKVGIVGGTGYTGVELLRLLQAEPAEPFAQLPQSVAQLLLALAQLSRRHPGAFTVAFAGHP